MALPVLRDSSERLTDATYYGRPIGAGVSLNSGNGIAFSPDPTITAGTAALTTLASDWTAGSKDIISQNAADVFNVEAEGASPSASAATNDAAILSAFTKMGSIKRTLLFPRQGTYKVSATIAPALDYLTIVGTGYCGSVLEMQGNATSDIIYMNGRAQCRIANLGFGSSVVKTGGAAIHAVGVNSLWMRDIQTSGANNWNAVKIDSGFLVHLNGFNFGNLQQHAIYLGTGAPADVFISNGAINDADNGVYMESSGGIVMTNMDILSCRTSGVKTLPPAGKVVGPIFATNVWSDTNFSHGWHLSSGGGSTKVVSLTNCWGCSNLVNGLLIDGAPTIDVVVSNSKFNNNGHDGVVINDGTYIVISDCAPCDNSVSLNNSYDGIAVGPNVQHFRLRGNTTGASPISGATKQRYGISVAAGCDYFMLNDNDGIGNVTAGILNTPGSAITRIQANNL